MIEINNKTRSKIDLVLVRKVAKVFLKSYRKQDCEISIAFVGDKAIRGLNKIYRKKDKITDVLAFSDKEAPLGEVIIDYAQIKRQAKRYGNSAKQELVFILVHGLLHLLGYDDKTEKDREEMERMGREFIKSNS